MQIYKYNPSKLMSMLSPVEQASDCLTNIVLNLYHSCACDQSLARPIHHCVIMEFYNLCCDLKNLSLVVSNNKRVDLSVHWPTLISTFVIHLLEMIMSILATSEYLIVHLARIPDILSWV